MRVMLQVITKYPKNPDRNESTRIVAYLPGMTFRDVPRVEVSLPPRQGHTAGEVADWVFFLCGAEIEIEVQDTFFTEEMKSSAHVQMVTEIRRRVYARHMPGGSDRTVTR